MINILDPDMIVIGGGVSRVQHFYEVLPRMLRGYVFGGEVSTPIVPAMYGDSSGVRGAAWLWPAGQCKSFLERIGYAILEDDEAIAWAESDSRMEPRSAKL